MTVGGWCSTEAMSGDSREDARVAVRVNFKWCFILCNCDVSYAVRVAMRNDQRARVGRTSSNLFLNVFFDDSLQPARALLYPDSENGSSTCPYKRVKPSVSSASNCCYEREFYRVLKTYKASSLSRVPTVNIWVGSIFSWITIR